MNRQYTGWGYVDWLEPDMDDSKIALNVGVVAIAPHAHMKAHLHFTEQVIYTLQGEGYSLIDGKKTDMSEKNVILHWKAGVTHEMRNTGETYFKHLMVSCPDNMISEELSKPAPEEAAISGGNAGEYLCAAIDGIRSQFLDTLHYPYIIFDAGGVVAAHSKIFPAFCRNGCAKLISTNSAPCMRASGADCRFKEGKEECLRGITLLYVPIIFQGLPLGYVKGGFVHTRPLEGAAPDSVYIAPQSSLQGAQLLMRRIAKAVSNFCEFHKFKNDLMERDLALAGGRQYQELLAASLENAENTMTDLKINSHFLLNTLNQMASMAIDGGMMPLYQSIVDLSKMFRYTLRNDSRTVALEKEIEYLSAYLKLQKLRYGEGLEFSLDVEQNIGGREVPFNFLMPIAENAFTHGFANTEKKLLSVSIAEKEGKLLFAIGNNGTPLAPQSRRVILLGMRSDTTHGLPMVYRKLKTSYGEDFTIDLHSDEKTGTLFSLTLPAEMPRREGYSS